MVQTKDKLLEECTEIKTQLFLENAKLQKRLSEMIEDSSTQRLFST